MRKIVWKDKSVELCLLDTKVSVLAALLMEPTEELFALAIYRRITGTASIFIN
jgi:hypothetical protein